ncbi:hypothetical protein PT974_00335 [Cladobotryum mycophilum]|uniref:Uncharacterized protein n=1 Tax=Cladobotryum mycophilum TaxID=491253 RepID=A0ABR0T1D4_9HYPO
MASLRLQIWEASLPDVDAPAVVFFRERTAEDLEAASWEGHADNPLGTLPVHVPLPQVYVNHEARRVAIKFCERSGLRMQFRPEIQRCAFFRPFSLVDDILYIPLSKGQEFQHAFEFDWKNEPAKKAYDPSFARNIAVSEPLASDPIFATDISQLYTFYHRTLHVIFDTPHEMDQDGPGFLSGSSWELRSVSREDAKTRASKWDHNYGIYYPWGVERRLNDGFMKCMGDYTDDEVTDVFDVMEDFMMYMKAVEAIRI